MKKQTKIFETLARLNSWVISLSLIGVGGSLKDVLRSTNILILNVRTLGLMINMGCDV